MTRYERNEFIYHGSLILSDRVSAIRPKPVEPGYTLLRGFYVPRLPGRSPQPLSTLEYSPETEEKTVDVIKMFFAT